MLAILMCALAYGHGIDPPIDREPALIAVLQVTVHLDRADSKPIYREEHLITELDQQFNLGKGRQLSGSWNNIDWRHDLIFIRITREDWSGTHDALAMARLTSNGLEIKQLYSKIEDFRFHLMPD